MEQMMTVVAEREKGSFQKSSNFYIFCHWQGSYFVNFVHPNSLEYAPPTPTTITTSATTTTPSPKKTQCSH